MEFATDILKPIKACICALFISFGFVFESGSLAAVLLLLLNVYVLKKSTSVTDNGIDVPSNFEKLQLLVFVFFALEIFLSVITFLAGFLEYSNEEFLLVGVIYSLVSFYGIFHSLMLRVNYDCHKPIR